MIAILFCSEQRDATDIEPDALDCWIEEPDAAFV